jgi:hypothetical protein
MRIEYRDKRGSNRLHLLSASLIALMSLFFSVQAFSGAWTAKKGTMYNKIAGNFFISTEDFDSDGNRVSSPSQFTDTNITYYAEYGITDKITMFGSLPYKKVEQNPDNSALPSESTTDFGDVEVGTRYNFSDTKKGVISGQALVSIPGLYDSDALVPVGNGDYQVEFRFLYGKSLWPRPMYYGLEFGYRFREGDPSDEWKFLGEYGYSPTDKWALRTKLDVTISAKNGATTGGGGLNPTLTNEYDLAKLELTVGRRVSKHGWIEFTWTPNIWGENTAAGQNFQLAYVFQTGVRENLRRKVLEGEGK